MLLKLQFTLQKLVPFMEAQFICTTKLRRLAHLKVKKKITINIEKIPN